MMQDIPKEPPKITRIYTKITAQKSILTESQQRSIEDLKKCMAKLQKPEEGSKSKTTGPVQVLLEKLDLAVNIAKVESIEYHFSNNIVVCHYVVNVIGDVGPLLLIIRAELDADSIKYLKEGNTASLSNLRLVLSDQQPRLISTKGTRVTSYKRFYKKNPSRGECMVDGLVDIESLDAYKKILDMKKPLEFNQRVTNVEEVLHWEIPESCKSETSRGQHTIFKLCDIARLAPKNVSLIGRISGMQRMEDSIRVKLEAIQSRDTIHVFIKGTSNEDEILFTPGKVVILSSLELRISTQGTIYAIMEFSLKKYRVMGNMSEKAAGKIRDLTIYPVHYIIDIPDTCAIRYTIKVQALHLWLNILQIKHIQLWNACSACEARMEKTDFCPSGCRDSHVMLKGKAIAYVQDGTGKALLFLKDGNIPPTFGLDEEKTEMVKGWIRGQGEFNLANKQKLSWREIWGFFCDCEMRRVPILCVPFCKVLKKGITKSKEDVEPIAMPKYIKSESTAEIFINGEIQGGSRAGRGVYDICLKAVAVLNDNVMETYYQLADELELK